MCRGKRKILNLREVIDTIKNERVEKSRSIEENKNTMVKY